MLVAFENAATYFEMAKLNNEKWQNYALISKEMFGSYLLIFHFMESSTHFKPEGIGAIQAKLKNKDSKLSDFGQQEVRSHNVQNISKFK